MTTTKKSKPAPEPVGEFIMHDSAPAPAEAAPAKPAVPQTISVFVTANRAVEEVSMEQSLKDKLETAGVSQAAIAILEDQEYVTEDALRSLTAQDYIEMGIKKASREALLRIFGQAAKTSPKPDDEEGEADPAPMAPAEVSAAAAQYGMDPNMVTMMMMGAFSNQTGMAMDLSGMVPVPAIVAGYNPKLRNFPYMIMGQLEASLGGVPIVVINADGSVNVAETTSYILSLQEGFPPAEDNVYYDAAGSPYEVIKVGVDAQSIYDSDPVDSSRPLTKAGMGIGNIRWNGVSLEVRQVVYFATQSGELTAGSESKLQWLRDHIRPGVTKETLRMEFPKALVLWREASRTGTLPMLKGQLSRSPRKPEVMPRRRADAGFRDTPGGGTRI